MGLGRRLSPRAKAHVGLTVLDASVLVAALDADDALHGRASRALVERLAGDVVLPATAYAEALVRPAAVGTVPVVDEFLDRASIRVQPTDRLVAAAAAMLRATHRIGLNDALVIATGDVLGADEVLTADRRWRGVSERVTLV